MQYIYLWNNFKHAKNISISNKEGMSYELDDCMI